MTVMTRTRVAIAAVLLLSLPAQGLAQGRGGRGGPPPTAQAAAPADFTGTWVAVVSEDWRWRMITPPPGDFSNIPLNAEGQRVGETWDPAAVEAAGEACRAYAAPAIMREPTRLRISWGDENTLRMETDAGTQTRLFHCDGTPPPGDGPREWQGYTAARWEGGPGRGGAGGIGLGVVRTAAQDGRALVATTTRVRPGYLRKNGVPFSGNVVVQEYFNRFSVPVDDTEWFFVTTVVIDPQYLNQPWVTTSHFKREPDDSNWNPQPCRAR
jgi:hypothetical protein